MALINEQKTQFMTDIRAIADLMVLVRERARALDQKWNSLAFGSGGANEFVAADLTGSLFDGLGITNLTNVVTTLQAFETWFNAGHDDNIEKVRA